MIRAGIGRAIGAAGVEIERFLGSEGGHEAAPHEQDEQRAHEILQDDVVPSPPFRVGITRGGAPRAMLDRKKRTRRAWGRKAGPCRPGSGASARSPGRLS